MSYITVNIDYKKLDVQSREKKKSYIYKINLKKKWHTLSYSEIFGGV